MTHYTKIRAKFTMIKMKKKKHMVVTYELEVAKQVASRISYVSYVAHVGFQTQKKNI